MSWTRLSEDFTSRAEVLLLSDAARWTFIEGLVWCNWHLTDGRLPKVVAPKVLTHSDDETMAELIKAEMVTEDPEAWFFDWSDQETAEQHQARQSSNRERQDRFRRHRAGDHSMCDRCEWVRSNGKPEDVTRYVTRDVTRESRPSNPIQPNPTRSVSGGWVGGWRRA